MHIKNSPRWYSLFLVLAILVSSCQEGGRQESSTDTDKPLQERLLLASDGDLIEIPEGVYDFDRTLSLDGIANITIRGAGKDKTILSFVDQKEGGEGIKVTADHITIEDLCVRDSKGDGIKIQNAEGVQLRNVKVEWSGGPKSTNGAYGLYPVSCQDVLVEKCEVTGASDAGIYVGQSEQIIVRNNYVYENVAGIEVENSFNGEVYANICEKNTGGILIFDLPELPVKNGKNIRVYENVIRDNNLPNFAPEGNMVATVPAGSGLLVMATTDVRVYKNEIQNHRTFSAAVVSYLINGKPYTDSIYNPFPSGIEIYNNTIISETEATPDQTRELGQMLAGLFGSEAPEIILDGMTDPNATEASDRICIRDNPGAKVAMIDAANNFQQITIGSDAYDCRLEELPFTVE